MLRLTRSTGAATPEQSTYPALINMLNAVGATLRPKGPRPSVCAYSTSGLPNAGNYALIGAHCTITRDDRDLAIPGPKIQSCR